MATTLNTDQILITGSETLEGVYQSAANSPTGGTGTFMDRAFFANNVTTDVYQYTLKEGYYLQVASGAVFDVQQCILSIQGRGGQAWSLRNFGQVTLGTAQIINGVTYPDTSTIVIFANGNGDWGNAHSYRAENASINQINCVMYAAGRRIFLGGGDPNWIFNARITGTHLDFPQSQLNVGGNISGEYLELINPALPNQAGPNAINWPLYPNNTFFNNIDALELGSGGIVNGFSFNTASFRIICVQDVNKVLQNAKRLPSDFTVFNGGNNNYGDIEWRNNFTGQVIDGDFSPIDAPVYYVQDQDSGNRNASGRYPSDLVFSGSGDSSGEFNLNLLLAYYGLTSAQFGGEPTGFRPIDFRFPYTMGVYKYGYSVTTLLIDEFVESLTQPFISLADPLITGTKAEALALTEINNPQELYDSMCAWQDDNFTGLDFRIGRQGDTVLLDSYNLIIDPSAVNVFAFDGTTITIKSSSFTGNLTTTGTVTDSSNTVVGSITDINGTTSPSSIALNAPNSNWAIYDNNGTRITSGSGNATYVNSRGTDTGTWSVVKHRKGYNSEIYTWVADDGSSNSFLFGEIPLLKPEGGNIYSGGATTGLTVSVNGDNYIEVDFPNALQSAQKVIDAQQDFLSTLDGLDWIHSTGITGAPLFGVLNGVSYLLNIQGFQYDSISGLTPESALGAVLISSASHINIRTENGGLSVVTSVESITAQEVYDLFINGNNADVFKADVTGLETKAQADSRQALLIAEHDQTQVDISNISFSDTAILSAISALNDISTADIRTELAAELARLDASVSSVAYDDTALTALVNDLPTLAQMEASAALTAIADITGLSVHSAADVVTAMQVVANDFKADVSGINFDDTAILNAISTLNDIDLATIEGSSILSKEATLNTIITNLSAIPTTDSVADLTPVLTAISNLNDPTVAEIVTGLQAVADDFKADLTGVAYDDAALIAKIDVIDSIVDSILVDTNELQSNQGNFATATGFATPSDVSNAQTAIIAEVNENETKIDLIPTSSSGYDDTNLISKVDAIDSNVDAIKLKTDTLVNTDVSAIETKSQADARQALLISEIQSGGGSTDLTPVLNAIAALNDLSVSDVEGSNLAKEATLTSIISSIASIPTTDNVADLTPILTAIANLNDVTASEVRAAFNAVDFQDKNTEAEVHAWLDSYGNKDNWKGDSEDYTSSLTVINDGIKKASKLIPHNTDLA